MVQVSPVVIATWIIYTRSCKLAHTCKLAFEWCSHFRMYSFPNMDMGSDQVECLFLYWFFAFCPYCSCFLERNNVSNSTKKSDIFVH